MTNKEAILVLKSTLVNLGRRSGKTAYAEALEMAITALQELDKNPTKPNNSNDEVNNSTATQSNGIESKVKGLTACRVPEDDCISRRAVIDEITEYGSGDATFMSVGELKRRIELSPSAQTEACEFYALCRHGRDENKLRARLGICEYCNADADGFVTPLEKNGHAFVRFGMNGWCLELSAKGWRGEAKIRYCPMCGRDLYVK